MFQRPYEVEKLRKMLRVPITNIEFDERYEYGKLYLDDQLALTIIYAKLYVHDELIGIIPYMSDKWGPMYDTSKQHELAWDKIYLQFQQVIFDKILEQEPLAVYAEIRDFRSLFVKDKNNIVIKVAFCNYIDDEWNIVVGGPNVERRKKVVTVFLQPPPPPDLL
jgi:hypothetical protein